MKPDKKKQKISRKEFLQMGGSILAGGTILGISGVTLWNNYTHKSTTDGNSIATDLANVTFQSPYKLVSSFSTGNNIEAFEVLGDNIIVSTADQVQIYQANGTLQSSFKIDSNLRDLAVTSNEILLLYPSHIEVFNTQGKQIRKWKAAKENSDYCSIAFGGGSVYITDAGNKNICQYSIDGNFQRIIDSPNRFIIPSYTFGITYNNGTIFCSNPGRHQVEKYSADGKYIGSFGEAGGAIGKFCGCCNPVHLSYTDTGDLITSEKGNPRISCYSPDGQFQSLLLDSRMLGGGNNAYRIKAIGDQLIAAGNNMVTTFKYDKALAANSACSSCAKNCPLRKGVQI